MRGSRALILALFLSSYVSSVKVYIDPSNSSFSSSTECTITAPDTYYCRSLVSAVSTLILNTDDPPQDIDILLSPGITHYLTTPLSIEAPIANITIGPADSPSSTGHSSNPPSVTISCSINEFDSYAVNGIVPVLQFTVAVDSVHIHDVQFKQCPGGVFVNNASKFVIERAEFRYFTNGAVDIYNTINIIVINTTFVHNGPLTSYFKLYGRYVVHSGGLSIGADILDDRRTGSPRIHIENCSFINNTAFPSDALQQTLTQVFIRELFTGRGGSLGLALNSPLRPYTVTIRHCLFSLNRAKLLGGAMYITLGWTTSHNITFDSNILTENESGFAGGATFVGSFGPGMQTKFDSIVFRDCLYIGNRAERGGGAVYAVPGTLGAPTSGIWNYMLFDGCEFIANRGEGYAAALWLASVDPYATQFNHKPVEVVNCMFINNISPDSTIMGTLFVPIVLSGHNIFAQNQGSALELFGSIADFTGTIEFLNTDSQLSNIGALHLVSFAQILLHEGVTILFRNNSGKFGASITTVSEAPWEGFAYLLYNPLCFFLYEANKTPPDQWNVNVSFVDNAAVVGSVGYLDSSSPCSWSQHDPPYFNKSNVLNWTPFKQINNSNTFHAQDENNMLIPNIQTYPIKIIVTNRIVQAYLGEVFALNIRAYDQLNHTVGVAVTLSASGNDPLHFSPSAALFTSSDQPLYTRVSSLDGAAIIEQDYKIEVRGFNQKMAIQSASFLLKLKECPPGYFLQDDGVTTKCMCTVNNDDVFHCAGTTITLNNRVWAAKDHYSFDHISTYTCPPGYCNCIRDESTGACVHLFDSNEPNGQCNCHRSGILCGECNRTDSSLTVLSYNCVTECSLSQWGMIVIIAIWGVTVCVSMAFIARVFIHQVVPSTLFPILYYIEFLSIGLSSSFDGFNPVFIYLYYVYSLLSFYFPYDFCFPDIGPVLLHSFKFLPLMLAIVIVPITLILSWKWLKVSTRSWYSVWMIFLLLYTHSLSSAISVLYCPSIPDDTSSSHHQWYLAGHIECFSGNHLYLTVLAVIVIIVCCLGTVGTLVMPVLLHCYQLPFVLKRLVEPLIDFHSTRGDQWFYSFDLIRRFLPTVMATVFPGNKYSVFIVFLLINSVIAYRRPYRSVTTNNAESFLLVTTALMYIVFIQGSPVVTINSGPTTEQCSAYASVSLSTILIALLYYLPVVLAVILVTVAVFRRLRKYVKGDHNHQSEVGRKLKSRKQSQIAVLADEGQQDFHLTRYMKREFSSTTIDVISTTIP